LQFLKSLRYSDRLFRARPVQDELDPDKIFNASVAQLVEQLTLNRSRAFWLILTFVDMALLTA
jgi:hypothetical protein